MGNKMDMVNTCPLKGIKNMVYGAKEKDKDSG